MRRGSQWARSVHEVTKAEKRTERGVERSIAVKEENRKREEEALKEEQRRQRREWLAEASFRRYVSYTKCFWCGLAYGKGNAKRTREHLIPRSLGGGDEGANVMYSHFACNQNRGNKMNWIPWHIHRQDGKVMWH